MESGDKRSRSAWQALSPSPFPEQISPSPLPEQISPPPLPEQISSSPLPEQISSSPPPEPTDDTYVSAYPIGTILPAGQEPDLRTSEDFEKGYVPRSIQEVVKEKKYILQVIQWIVCCLGLGLLYEEVSEGVSEGVYIALGLFPYKPETPSSFSTTTLKGFTFYNGKLMGVAPVLVHFGPNSIFVVFSTNLKKLKEGEKICYYEITHDSISLGVGSLYICAIALFYYVSVADFNHDEEFAGMNEDTRFTHAFCNLINNYRIAHANRTDWLNKCKRAGSVRFSFEELSDRRTDFHALNQLLRADIFLKFDVPSLQEEIKSLQETVRLQNEALLKSQWQRKPANDPVDEPATKRVRFEVEESE